MTDLPALQPRPDVDPASPWSFPQVDRRLLANGLDVVTVPLPGQEILVAALSLDLPLALEPRELEGVSSVLVRTADEGTTAHPAAAFAEQLEAIAASYDGTSRISRTLLSVDAPRRHVDRALELFVELLTGTALADADVSRQIDTSRAQLAHVAQNGPSLAALAAGRALWAEGGRSTRPTAGTHTTLDAITPTEVRAFWERTWRPAGGVLVLAGDRADEVDLLSLAGWTGAREGVGDFTPERPAGTPTRVVLVDRPDAVQADVAVQAWTPGRDHPLWPALRVACTALGGSFGSRLNTVLREEKGWSYGVGMSAGPVPGGALASVGGAFRTEVAAQALVTAMELIDPSSGELTGQEVEAARRHLVGVAPLQYDTPQSVASQVAALAAVGLPASWVNTYLDALAQVGVDGANEAWRMLLPASRWQIGVSGRAVDLAPELERSGFDVEVVTPSELLG